MWKIKGLASCGDYTYAVVPEHPNRTRNNYVFLHRVIMEIRLGRILGAREIVHHRDGNKKNNNVRNLEVMTLSQHTSLHMRERGYSLTVFRCSSCGSMTERRANRTKGMVALYCSRRCYWDSLKGVKPGDKREIVLDIVGERREFLPDPISQQDRDASS